MWCCSIVTGSLGTAYYSRLLNLICTEPTYSISAVHGINLPSSGQEVAVRRLLISQYKSGDLGDFRGPRIQ